MRSKRGIVCARPIGQRERTNVVRRARRTQSTGFWGRENEEVRRREGGGGGGPSVSSLVAWHFLCISKSSEQDAARESRGGTGGIQCSSTGSSCSRLVLLRALSLSLTHLSWARGLRHPAAFLQLLSRGSGSPFGGHAGNCSLLSPSE